jgi:uncharacterized cupin superfamily protein
VQKVVIKSYPDGRVSEPHFAGHKNFLIYLQGTQVMIMSDGKEFPLKPGMAVLAEDWTGKGHTYRCEAKTGKKVCLVVQLNIGELDRTMPLRAPPAK